MDFIPIPVPCPLWAVCPMAIPSFLWSHFLICKNEMAITNVVKTATMGIS